MRDDLGDMVLPESPTRFPLSESFVHRRIFGAAKGFVTGGPLGAVGGFIGGGKAGGGAGPAPVNKVADSVPAPVSRRAPARGGIQITPPRFTSEAQVCPPGRFRVGSRCVDILAAPPGGVPFTTEAGVSINGAGGAVAFEFGAVQGAFGLPATVPMSMPATRLRCPRGMVLAIDNLCYPRSVLPRRSKNRKWRAARRPPVSNKTMRALAALDTVDDALKKLSKAGGFKPPKRK